MKPYRKLISIMIGIFVVRRASQMKRAAGLFFLVFFVLAANAEELQNSNFDFSGIDQFWKIVSILEQDQEPDDRDWTALFQTPGYRELISREWPFEEEFFKKNFRLAFKPSLASALKEELEKKDNRWLMHYVRIKSLKEPLLRHQKWLQTAPLMTKAMGMAQEYLPQGLLKDVPLPPISFIFFDLDARGYSPIVVDMLFALEERESLFYLLAHEAHHYYRDKILAYAPGELRAGHATVMWVLNQVQAEGIADQIDKRTTYFEGGEQEKSPGAVRYRELVDESPRIIADMNAFLEQMADSPSRLPQLGQELRRRIPQSGHPTGYYMARAIIAELGGEQLINTVGNPFAFFYLYNIAARKSDSYPVFSNKSVEFLRSLERAYCSAPEYDLARESMQGGLDYSAVEQFWRIVELQEQDRNPTEQQWSTLFENRAYQELMTRERGFSRDTLTNLISLVFKPSRAEELQTQLKKGAIIFLDHFAEVKRQRKELKEHIEWLKTDDLFNQIMEDIKPFLPGRAVREHPFPPIFYVFFSKDLRYGYPVMLIDPLCSLSQKAISEYYLKLYAFNYYRNKILSYDPQDIRQKHVDLVDALDALQFGGLMDCITVKHAIYADEPARMEELAREYQVSYQSSPQIIRNIDELLRKMLHSPEDSERMGTLVLKALPHEGRPTGHYMAKAVIENLGKDCLIENCGNPFAFIRLYNQAAAGHTDRYPVFSPEALRVIEMLEREYAQKDK